MVLFCNFEPQVFIHYYTVFASNVSSYFCNDYIFVYFCKAEHIASTKERVFCKSFDRKTVAIMGTWTLLECFIYNFVPSFVGLILYQNVSHLCTEKMLLMS